jgi:hypothetical protein
MTPVKGTGYCFNFYLKYSDKSTKVLPVVIIFITIKTLSLELRKQKPSLGWVGLNPSLPALCKLRKLRKLRKRKQGK